MLDKLDKKYSNILTAVLIIAIIIIMFLIGKMVFSFFENKKINDNAEEAIADFDRKIEDAETSSNDNNNLVGWTAKTDLSNFTYGGYNMMGYIQIPAINIKYPVLETVTTHSIEIAVAIRAGVGLNKVGNTVIVGHNYKNGVFFSDLNKLKINDIVYITDRSGTKIKYKIYNIFSATPEDTSFYNRDTEGKREITLSTCSDNTSMRTIIYAREEIEEEQKDNQQTNQISSNTTQNNINNNVTNNANTMTNTTPNPTNAQTNQQQ